MVWLSTSKLSSSLCVLLVLVACGQPQEAAQALFTPTIADPPVQRMTTPLAVATLTAVSPSAATPVGSLQGGFAEQLRSKGLTVDIAGPVAQPFLRTPGTILRLSGGNLAQPDYIQVYEYADTATAEGDANRVQPDTSMRWTEPDGTTKTMTFAWEAPPHFYRAGRTLVIYVGADHTLTTLLTELLGPQFAGR